jgi:hypothetical protein
MDAVKQSYSEFNKKISLYNNKNNYINIDSNEQLIYNDIDEICHNPDLAKHFIENIMTPEKIIKECLTFDLLNFNPNEKNKTNTFNGIFEIAINALKKYQYIVGGYSIEDPDWIICDKNNNRFKLKENQKILYNSVCKKNCDRELIWFLESLLNYIKKHNNNTKINIKYDIFEDKHNSICWIIYKFTNLS